MLATQVMELLASHDALKHPRRALSQAFAVVSAARDMIESSREGLLFYKEDLYIVDYAGRMLQDC